MSDKVKYGEIIDALSKKTGFSKNKSEAFTKSLIAIVKEELKENGKASITNFGSFKVKEVAERQGQNPQTGEPITIPAHNRASFTPYKALRERVNAKYAHLEPELISESSSKKQEKKETSVSKPKERSIGIQKTRQRSNKGSNVGLIIVAVLLLAVIVIASAWFLMNPGEEKMTSQSTQTPVENVEEKTVQTESDESVEKPTSGKDEKPVVSSDPNTSSYMETYTVRSNEWFWVIAEKVYGNPHFWPLIFQENFDEDVHPDSLKENATLAIPQLQGSAGNLSKQDYRNLFEAAQTVSMAYHNAGNEVKAFEYARYSRQWERASKE